MIIGAGPVRPMAAWVLAEAGYPPMVLMQCPSCGQKICKRGVAGLNLTHGEDSWTFKHAIGNLLTPVLEKFNSIDLCLGENFGFETFVGLSV